MRKDVVHIKFFQSSCWMKFLHRLQLPHVELYIKIWKKLEIESRVLNTHWKLKLQQSEAKYFQSLK